MIDPTELKRQIAENDRLIAQKEREMEEIMSTLADIEASIQASRSVVRRLTAVRVSGWLYIATICSALSAGIVFGFDIPTAPALVPIGIFLVGQGFFHWGSHRLLERKQEALDYQARARKSILELTAKDPSLAKIFRARNN